MDPGSWSSLGWYLSKEPIFDAMTWALSVALAQRWYTRRWRSALALPYACPHISDLIDILPSLKNSNDRYKQSYTSRRGTLRAFEVQLSSGMNPVTVTMASGAPTSRNIVDMQLVSEASALSSFSGLIIVAACVTIPDGIRGCGASSSSINLVRVTVTKGSFSFLN